jgi:osmoprotectant transport system permease protein
MRLALRDPLLFALAAAASFSGVSGAFLSQAANRLVVGAPLSLWQTSDHAAVLLLAPAGAALLALAFAERTRIVQLAALLVALGALVLLVFAAGSSAAFLMEHAPRATRIALGAGFWASAFFLAIIALLALQRLGPARPLPLLIVTACVGAIIALFATGHLDALSLLREYAVERAAFWREFLRHCLLVASAVIVAVALGAPLGLLVARRPAMSGAIFGTLNLLQTIPSIALFGLLIAPLAALGIGGIGIAPALIALVLYSLLPVARNTEAGISSVDRAVIDAARGMGFTPTQILWRVELPLGLPVFLTGLRIVTVQAIGLAAVAALIGAGGLGTFIFQGIGQYATDLVLLGALPTILLALIADLALGLVQGLATRTSRA